MNANTGVAMESKETVGSEMEMAGVMEKSKVMGGLESEMGAGTESEVDMEVGTDSKQTADLSRNIGMGSAIMTAGGDVGVDTQLTVAGTDTGDDTVAVVWTEVHTNVERFPSVCVAASEFSALANAQLGIAGMETETAEQSEVCTGTGTCMCSSE